MKSLAVESDFASQQQQQQQQQQRNVVIPAAHDMESLPPEESKDINQVCQHAVNVYHFCSMFEVHFLRLVQ